MATSRLKVTLAECKERHGKFWREAARAYGIPVTETRVEVKLHGETIGWHPDAETAQAALDEAIANEGVN